MATAKRKNTEIITSLTDTAVNDFLYGTKKGEGTNSDVPKFLIGQCLQCEKIRGFHLLKTKTGGSYRLRYMSDTGQRKVAVIASAGEMKGNEAAYIARDWRINGEDPLAKKEERRKTAKTEAEAAASRTLRKYIDGAYAEYLAEHHKDAHETLGRIRLNFAKWLDNDMMTITEADVLAWQADRKKAGQARATYVRAFGALKSMYKTAATGKGSVRVLPHNPLEKITLDKPTLAEKKAESEASEERMEERRMLTDAEMAALVKGMELWNEERRVQRRNSRTHGKPHLPCLDNVRFAHWGIPFFTLALYTGMRPGDLLSLTWEELNVPFARLQKIPGKTAHHQNPVKLDLDLQGDVLEAMRAWWQQQGKPLTGFVFESEKTGRALTAKSYERPWQHILRCAGLPADLQPYSLRHSFISRLVAAGVPLLTIAKLVGHRSVAMIEKHYSHLCPRSASQAMSIIGAAIKAADAATKEKTTA